MGPTAPSIPRGALGGAWVCLRGAAPLRAGRRVPVKAGARAPLGVGERRPRDRPPAACTQPAVRAPRPSRRTRGTRKPRAPRRPRAHWTCRHCRRAPGSGPAAQGPPPRSAAARGRCSGPGAAFAGEKMMRGRGSRGTPGETEETRGVRRMDNTVVSGRSLSWRRRRAFHSRITPRHLGSCYSGCTHLMSHIIIPYTAYGIRVTI